MFKKESTKFVGKVMRIVKKILPEFSVHYVIYTVLFFVAVFSVVGIVTATTPNPGHPWTEVGDGVFNVTNNQTAVRTYTFPDANATILTTNALVTVGQGGTGAGSFTSNGVLYGNGTSAIGVTAAGTTGQCLIGTTAAAPSWGSCTTGAVTTIGTIDSLTKSANGAVISGSNLVLQTADASNPGLVSTGAQTFAGLKTFNGGITLAANAGLTMTSGTGVFAQTFSNTAASSALTQNITNGNTGVSAVTVNGYDITLSNATNTNNTNTLNGVNFNAASNNNTNTINGINFASATGYTNFIKTPTFNLSSAGAITGATGIVSSNTIQFSSLTTNGPVYTSLGNGTLTTTAPTSGAIGYWSRAGTTLSPTTANDIISVSTNSTTASNKAIEGLQTGATTGTDYAGYFSNTGAATTNVGLYATASGGTNNYAAIFDAGNVGIGTTTPGFALDVLNATTGQTASNRVANFSNAGATFNTTSSALISYGGYFSSTSTRSAGANALTNIGAYFDASGGQNNYAVAVGDTTFNYTAPVAIASSVTGPGGFNTGITIKASAPSIVLDDVNADDFMIAGEGSRLILYGGASATTAIGAFAPSGLYIGSTSAASARLQIVAGTATAGTAPLKFTSGTNMTAVEAGAMEWDGTQLYLTSSTPTRNIVAQVSGSAALSTGAVYATTNGYLTSTAPTSGSLGFWTRTVATSNTLSPATIGDEVNIGSATDQGAYTLQNTGAFYQNGNVTLAASAPCLSFQLGSCTTGDNSINRSGTTMIMNGSGDAKVSAGGTEGFYTSASVTRVGFGGQNVLINSSTDNGHKLDVNMTGTSLTTSRRTINSTNAGTTFDTTAGALFSYGGYFSSTSTRISGPTNTLTNVGLYATASGAQTNYALNTVTPGGANDLAAFFDSSAGTNPMVQIQNETSTGIAGIGFNVGGSYWGVGKYGTGFSGDRPGSFVITGTPTFASGTDAFRINNSNEVFIGGSTTDAGTYILQTTGNSLFTTSSTVASNKTIEVNQTGATTGTDYAGYFSNTGAATTNVGLYATATGATNNYAGIFESGEVLVGTAADAGAYSLQVAGKIYSTQEVSIGSGDLMRLYPSGGDIYIDNASATNFIYREAASEAFRYQNNVGFKIQSGLYVNQSNGNFDTQIRGQTNANLLYVDASADSVGIGTATPSALFSVGASSQFQVASTGAVTLAANAGITMSSGTGVFAQTFSNTAASSAETKNITNGNTGVSAITVNGYDLTLSNATNTNNTNTLNGVNFNAASNNNTNTINGINFASATGYTNFIKTPTFVLSSGGAITGATGITSSGTITFSGLSSAGTQCVQASSTGVLSVTGSACGSGSGGVTTLSAIGSSPNANGATITGTVLNLEPANTSFGGVVTTAAQTFAGLKTFNGGVTLAANQNLTLTSGTGQILQTYAGTTGIATSIASSTLTSGSLIDLTVSGTAGSTGQKGINVSMSGANSLSGQTTYGGYFSNTNGGTNPINVGLYATASSGTNNYSGIFDQGNVGIGITTPTAKLQIQGDGGSTTNAPLALSVTGGTGGLSGGVAGATGGGITLTAGAGGNGSVADGLGGDINLIGGSAQISSPGNSGGNVILNGGNGLTDGNVLLANTRGAVSVGSSTTTSLFNVGSSAQFQVNSSGNISSIGGAAHTIQNATGALSIDAATSGALNLNNTGTGDVLIAGGSAATGCTIANATGNLTCTGNVIGSNNGTIGYWSRNSGTGVLSPATANDIVTISTNAATGTPLALTSSAITTSGSSGLLNTVTISGSAAASTYYGQKLALTNNQTTNADTLYGQHISFTDAGTLANTVTGLYVDATTANASDTTYSAIFMGGNVGIGTATPTYGLDINKTNVRIDSGGTTDSIQINDLGITNYNGSGRLTYILDTDTYGFQFGSNIGELRVYTNNVIRQTISSGGNVLFNGTSANADFQIKGQTNANLFYVDASADSVGIGTNLPSSKLDITTSALGTTQTTSSGLALVNTTLAAVGAQQISPAIRWSGSGWKTDVTAASQTVDFRAFVTPVQGTANPTGYLGFGSSINGAAYNDNQLVLTSAGSVGIGTTNPSSLLNIYSATADTALTIEHSSVSNGDKSRIVFQHTAIGKSAEIWSAQPGLGVTDLSFKTNDATSLLTRMYISGAGKVGINTTGPGGQLEVAQTATATGALKGLVYTGAVNTNQTLSTEIPAVTFTTAGRQWATGALTTQREVLITQPTYSFVGASTITDAATVGIAGAPAASTNATLTNSHGILVQAGAVGAGTTNSYGITVNAQTGGTNNYAAQFLGGNVGIGDSSPAALLTVGSGDLFQVNSSGAIAGATGITSSGTITFSGLSTAGIVHNSAAGVLSTSLLAAADVTADSLDFTEFKDSMTLDATTDIASNGFNLTFTNSANGTQFAVNRNADGTNSFGMANTDVGTNASSMIKYTNNVGATTQIINGGGNYTFGNNTYFIDKISGNIFLTARDGTGFIDFQTGGLGVANSKMRVTGAGEVLIGSTTDAGTYNLQVTGNSLFTTSSTVASNKGIEVNQTGATVGTDYGGYFTNTGAATTNVGLYATASGATNNYAAIFDAGRVGIGTTSPATFLNVQGTTEQLRLAYDSTHYTSFVNSSNGDLTMTGSSTTSYGAGITLLGGNSAVSGGTSGAIALTGGNGTVGNSSGGAINLTAGNSVGTVQGAGITILSGNNPSAGSGAILIKSSDVGGNASSGDITLRTGDLSANNTAGNINLITGTGVASGNGSGGSIFLTAADGQSTGGVGGSVTVKAGAAGGGGTAGVITFQTGGTNPRLTINGVGETYFGNGVTNASPVGYSLNATGGSGTDIAGGNFSIAGGKGTGNAAGGYVSFLTSNAGSTGTTLQSLTEKMRLNVAGELQIGSTSDLGAYKLQVTGDANFVNDIYQTSTTGIISANSGGVGMGYNASFGNGVLFPSTSGGLTNPGALIVSNKLGTWGNRMDFIARDAAGSTSKVVASVNGEAGGFGVGIITPNNLFEASPMQYATGTASQTGTTVTGSGTTFTSAMVGSPLVFADGTRRTITTFTDATHVVVAETGAVSSQGYRISYPGLIENFTGETQIGSVTDMGAYALQVTSSGNSPAVFNSPGDTSVLIKSGNYYPNLMFESLGGNADIVVYGGEYFFNAGSTTGVPLSGTTGLVIGTYGATAPDQGDIRFREAIANGTNYVGFQAPASITADVLWTLPSSDSSGCFQSNGTGTISIASCAGGGGGVTTVGTFSGSSQTNGANITGSTITFGPADTTNPGMVTASGSQTFGGSKIIDGTANTAVNFQVKDATNAYFTVNSQTGTSGVSAYTFANTSPTIASAAGAQFIQTTFTPGTVNFTGTTTITGTGTASNIGELYNQLTINGNNTYTISEASNMLINGAVKATSSVGTETLTNSYGLNILAGAALNGTGGAVTNGYGLSVNAPTGATNNYAAVFNGGNVGIGTSAPDNLLNISATSGLDQGVHIKNTGVGATDTAAIKLENGSAYSTYFMSNAASSTPNLTGFFTQSANGFTILNSSAVRVLNVLQNGSVSIPAASVTTGTTTASAFNLTANSLTTGTGMYLSSTSLTSGTMLDIAVTSTPGNNGLTGQKGINVLITGTNSATGQTTYGGYFKNTHSNSGTNIGLAGNASGGTNNYAIQSEGNLLIGLDTDPVNYNLVVSPTVIAGSTVGYQFVTKSVIGGTNTPLTFYNDGKVGIDTTSPASVLDVTPTGTYGAAGVSGINSRAHTVTLSGANPTTYTTFYGNQIGAMTLVGTNINQTVTDAAGLVVSPAIKSTNVAVTNTHGILVPAVAVSTATNAYGLTVNSPTGATNSYAAQFQGGNVGIGDSSPLSLLTVGSGDLFQVNTNGDQLAAFTVLDGSTTTNGTGAASTSMTVTSGTNFDVGNYIKVDNTGSGNCSTGVTICYAKITAKATNVLTLSTALTWATGKNVTEWHIPEIGATDLASTLTNRYGRGYFIGGTVAGNSSTFYNDGAIFTGDATSENSIGFSIRTGSTTTSGNSGDITIDVGSAAGTAGTVFVGNTSATAVTIGRSGQTTTIGGNLSVTGTLAGAGPTTGTSGYWARSSTTLSPATANDILTVSTNAATGTPLALTSSAITTTGSAGFTNTVTISGSAASSTYYGSKLALTNNQTTNADTLYGQHISFTDAGTLANTVTGLYVNATTANANDTTYAAAFMGGNVGIGTAAPAEKLHVVGRLRQDSVSGTGGTGEFLLVNGSNLLSTTGINPGIDVFHDSFNMYGFNLGYTGATSRYSLQTFFSDLGDFVIASHANGSLPTGQASFTNRVVVRGDSGNVGINTSSPSGKLEVAQTATATGALKGLVYTGAVNTNQTLSTEIPAVTFTTAGRQWATGALTTQREVLITQPTYSFVGASTITDAANLGIAGAPIAGTNATLTNSHAILVQAGAVAAGTTNSYGLTVNAQTGATNNYTAAFLGGNVGIGSAAPTALLYIKKDAIGTTPAIANGIYLQNTTAAALNAQQMSPSIVLGGNGWQTATSGSMPVAWKMDVLPVQGAATPNSFLQFFASINGGAFSDIVKFDTTGGLVTQGYVQATTSIGANGQVTAGTTSYNQKYRTTNAGADIFPELFAGGTTTTAGTPSISLEGDTNTNGITLAASNGTLNIARAGINITNLTNTAGSEAGDLIFLTQSGGTAMSEKLRVAGTGTVTVAANGGLTMASGTGQFTQTYTGTTTNALSVTANSLTSGAIINLASAGTGGLTNQKGINITLSGINGTAGQTTYGAFISNTHAGLTSTDVGLYATAGSGTTASYAGLFQIGDTTANGVGLKVKAGVVQFNATSQVVERWTDSADTDLGYVNTDGILYMSNGVGSLGTTGYYFTVNDMELSSLIHLGWGSGNQTSTKDIDLFRAAAGTMSTQAIDAGTNAITYASRLSHITSGTATTGFGVGQQYEAENALGTARVVGTVELPYTNATNAAESSDFVVKLISGGTLTERMRLTSAGALTVTSCTGCGGGLTINTTTISGSNTNGVLYADGAGKLQETATGGAGTLCLVSTNGGTPSFGACSGSASTVLSSLTAATAANSIDSLNNTQTWNWSTLTTQKGFVLDSTATALTTGGILGIGSTTTAYTHGAAETGSLATLTFKDSTSGAFATQTNGLLVSPTLNMSGASARILNGVDVEPTITACGTTGGTCTLTSFETNLPALTQSTTNTFNINGFNVETAGGLVQNTAAGTINWNGVNIVTPALTETTGTVIANGLNLTFGSAGAGAAVNGINIGNSAGGASTNETAINIGTGWDTGINVGSGLITLGTGSSAAGKITLSNATNNNTVSLQTGATSSPYTWTLPTADASGCLQSNGSGTLSIATCGDVNNQSFTSSGNWTIPTGALMVFVETWGGGGGGGGGSAGNLTTSHSGGGGGGGAAYVTSTFAATSLGTPGSTVVAITVGSGGTAGNGSAGNGNGNAGGPGGSSCFSTTANCAGNIYVRSFGGGGGAPGSATNSTAAGGGGGGGSEAVGANATSGTGATGGAPAGSAANTSNAGSGGGGGATGNATAASGGTSNFGGGGGGASQTTGVGNSGNGGGSVIGGSGGGAGGTIAVTTYTLRSGGSGGTGSAISGGGGTAGATNGAAGGNGANGVGGGGDGGGGGATNNAGNGGAGGAGGLKGGGGGGGGASTNAAGGAGGAGGAGYVRVWSYRGQGADLAEIYGTNDSTIGAGDIVAIDPDMRAGVKKSSRESDPTVIGVVSTSPGLVIGTVEDPGATPVMVALAGRVPVKVNMENGPIKKGDYLTPSSVPGVAMKSTKAGLIIGQSMTDYTTTDMPGIVVAFIKSGPSNGSKLSDVLLSGLTTNTSNTSDTTLVNPNLVGAGSQIPVTNKTIQQQALAYFNTGKALLEKKVDLSEVFADRVTAGLEVITPKLYANDINTDTIHAATGVDIGLVLDANGKFVVGTETENKVTNADGTTTTTKTQNPVITFDSLGNATFAGTVSAKEIKVGDVAGISAITDQINQLAQGQEAFTLTASVMNTLTGALTIAQADILKLTDEINALNTKTDTLATAGLDVESRLKIVETLLAANAFNSLSSVNTNTLTVSGDTTFAGLSTFGNSATFNGTISLNGQATFIVPPLFNSDTGGFALVKQGDKRVHVGFDQPYLSTPVVNTSMAFDTTDNIDDATAATLFTDDIKYIIVGKDQNGFTILLNKKATRDIRFSWNALSVKDPKVFESVIEGLTIDPTPAVTGADGGAGNITPPADVTTPPVDTTGGTSTSPNVTTTPPVDTTITPSPVDATTPPVI